jgi:hypothetical protein
MTEHPQQETYPLQPCFGIEYESGTAFCDNCRDRKECWVKKETGCIPEFIKPKKAGAPVTPQPPDQFDTYPGEYDSRPAPSPETKQPKCDDCLFRFQCTLLYFPPCERMARQDEQQAAAQAREKLFEAIRAERDPHQDYVDWDSIEAAYNRTGGDER